MSTPAAAAAAENVKNVASAAAAAAADETAAISIFEGCTEACGWVAAVITVLAFGSYGVPLKTAAKVEVHPLVMQTYKSLTCFGTCWLVLLAGEDLRWSNWGIASGLFWVPGSTCGIYGIRNAGLAVAVGTWSSITVLTSFIFGIIIFQEGVKNIWYTICAFTLLIVGLIGMAKYSSASPSKPSASVASIPGPPSMTPMHTISSRRRSNPPFPAVGNTSSKRADLEGSGLSHQKLERNSSFGGGSSHNGSSSNAVGSTKMQPFEVEPLVEQLEPEDAIMRLGGGEDADRKMYPKDAFIFNVGAGRVLVLTRRQTGILGAVINGGWGGMNLIPLHYAMAQDGLSGAAYLISYATGSLIVTAGIWILLAAYYYLQTGTWEETTMALPKFHLNHLFWPGLWAGLLYSVGNFGSILAVSYLGQSTGFSFCMMQLFVSGLWGVLYFHEIRGRDTIVKWFLSAVVAVTGIIWLSYEHEGESMGHRR